MTVTDDIEALYRIRRQILQIEPSNAKHKAILDKAYSGLSSAIQALEALTDSES